jgi:Prion-inhibition and propagation
MEKGSHQGHDLTFLVVRLNVERTKLLLWGERIGVWPTSHPATTERQTYMNPALHRKKVLSAVVGVMGSMMALFDGSLVLADRYISPSNIGNPRTALVASNDLFTAASAVAEAARDRAQPSQKSFSATQRIRWVLKDKASSEKLLNDFRQLNDDLVSLLPPSNSAKVSISQNGATRSASTEGLERNPTFLPGRPYAVSRSVPPFHAR